MFIQHFKRGIKQCKCELCRDFAFTQYQMYRHGTVHVFLWEITYGIQYDPMITF